MKFSDLVVLGSTIIEFDPTVYLQDDCGCLIGMAAAAKHGIHNLDDGQCWVIFPWLHEKRELSCPVCGTVFPRASGSISCVAVHIAHRKITFDDALVYIRSIEPQEFDEDLECPEERVRI